MKIAVGSDDQKTIRKKHFGESSHYIVFEILNGEVVGREVRHNITAEEDESHHGKSGEVMELLNDCGLFIARSMGKKSMRNISQKGIECILTSIENADEAVERFLSGEEEPFQYFDEMKDALISCAERRLTA